MAILFTNEDIKKYIPHRYPMLLVDQILEVGETAEGNSYIIGKKNVSANEGFFQGHFPEYAVMPGVLIIEALAQTGAMAVLTKPEHQGKLVFFTGIDKAKFRRQVVPGDTLELYVETIKLKDFHGKVIGSAIARATVEGELAATAEISFIAMKQEDNK
jgi:beta-hydroxyacyl-[acyl carrier protein] dehydratase FabZ